VALLLVIIGRPAWPSVLTPLKAEEIQLSLNVQSVWYLDRLIETGLYGNNRAEAAKIVVFDHCKILITQEKLKMAPPLPPQVVEVADVRR
jgi:hypothetical protein